MAEGCAICTCMRTDSQTLITVPAHSEILSAHPTSHTPLTLNIIPGWVSLGQEPNILQLQRVLHVQIADAPLPEHVSNDVRLAEAALVKAAAGKRCLLVLDDIWSEEHAAPLTFVDTEDCSSAILLTTRISSLIPGSLTLPVDLLSQEDAVQLLMQCGGVADILKTRNEPPAAAVTAAEM